MSTPLAAPPWPRRLLGGLERDGTPSLDAHHKQHGPMPPRRVAGADPVLVELIVQSGLLGRGGAGFPTGRKMRSVAAGARRPVVVGNGAEGEPASGKDALLLARAPHLVLDGLQVAARAVGADIARLLVHKGTGQAARLRAAVAERRQIDDVVVLVDEVPARYVASEESALVHWLNGGDAKPTFRPPRPFEQGVGKRPTLVNNVETLAHVALVARHGAEWFRAVGDSDEPGTLLVTVTDQEGNARVAEVPTGVRIGDVVAGARGSFGDVGGHDNALAVLVGGYFGTWLPMTHARQLPLTHRGLRSAGGALGAGVIAVLPAGSCGLAETSRVMDYLAAHNAGQCGPCVNGLPAIAQALRSLTAGNCDDLLWSALERWLSIVPGRGACRHPDGAIRLVASALSVFAADVAVHRSGRMCEHALAAPWLPVPVSTHPLTASRRR